MNKSENNFSSPELWSPAPVVDDGSSDGSSAKPATSLPKIKMGVSTDQTPDDRHSRRNLEFEDATIDRAPVKTVGPEGQALPSLVPDAVKVTEPVRVLRFRSFRNEVL